MVTGSNIDISDLIEVTGEQDISTEMQTKVENSNDETF